MTIHVLLVGGAERIKLIVSIVFSVDMLAWCEIGFVK